MRQLTEAIKALLRENDEPKITKASLARVRKALRPLHLTDTMQAEIEQVMGFRDNNGKLYPVLTVTIPRKSKAHKFDWTAPTRRAK